MMGTAKVEKPQRKTRIQRANEQKILEAALEVFSQHGFRGSTIDQISEEAGMSKPNLLYYFKSKQDIHETLLSRLLDSWLAPMRALSKDGDPLEEILNYVRLKVEMSRDFPRESRLFANEIIQGAPRIKPILEGEINDLLNEKAAIIGNWMEEGKLKKVDPKHLIFSIWATTQHYADFEEQVRMVLGRGIDDPVEFENTKAFLVNMFTSMLKI
ncbi:TetR family transcriptional regulator C-terminal domain-containing protein [Maritalea porphyrae]|uniref:TetR family transcriptional regulator C-terminal domain-containing protein n=2 Tax=Maritalea TaxID=623276 RepID=UPI0022AF2AAA|nr:TetR family transcriptional regulator C-terminal domain-containing protein [Maritalea porphyrae]MCZ4271095.1 TetR family transcriptional regulator C-terminal domain-containing protein [Maritalea porphyrae]